MEFVEKSSIFGRANLNIDAYVLVHYFIPETSV